MLLGSLDTSLFFFLFFFCTSKHDSFQFNAEKRRNEKNDGKKKLGVTKGTGEEKNERQPEGELGEDERERASGRKEEQVEVKTK
jgi:hypothetical protein